MIYLEFNLQKNYKHQKLYALIIIQKKLTNPKPVGIYIYISNYPEKVNTNAMVLKRHLQVYDVTNLL